MARRFQRADRGRDGCRRGVFRRPRTNARTSRDEIWEKIDLANVYDHIPSVVSERLVRAYKPREDKHLNALRRRVGRRVKCRPGCDKTRLHCGRARSPSRSQTKIARVAAAKSDDLKSLERPADDFTRGYRRKKRRQREIPAPFMLGALEWREHYENGNTCAL